MLKNNITLNSLDFMDTIAHKYQVEKGTSGYYVHLIYQVQSDMLRIIANVQNLDEWYRCTDIDSYVAPVVRDITSLKDSYIDYETYFPVSIAPKNFYIREAQDGAREAQDILEAKKHRPILPLLTPEQLHQGLYRERKEQNFLARIRTPYVIQTTSGDNAYKKQQYSPVDGDNLVYFCHNLKIALDTWTRNHQL